MPITKTTKPKPQRGVALFIVIIFTLLATLLAIFSFRSAIYNELILSNDADYQRAFETAQTLIQDAELDIRNELSDGSRCKPDIGAPQTCRSGAQILRFPSEEQELTSLFITLQGSNPPCKDGICLRNLEQEDFWNNNGTNGVTFSQMQLVGARYGQFTGAQTGTNSNPILLERNAPNRGGWYWIEVIPYKKNASNSALILNTTNNNSLSINADPSIVYRITAISFGLKRNTLAVIQQTYARKLLTP